MQPQPHPSDESAGSIKLDEGKRARFEQSTLGPGEEVESEDNRMAEVESRANKKDGGYDTFWTTGLRGTMPTEMSGLPEKLFVDNRAEGQPCRRSIACLSFFVQEEVMFAIYLMFDAAR